MKISTYELKEELGRGATSIVYRTEFEGNPFAIKVMMKTNTDDAVSTALMIRKEAATIARLNHPSLVRIVEVGDQDGQSFIVMELVEGKELAEIIKLKGRLPEDQVLSLAKSMAGALAVAHRLGLIHRDIKPNNILVADNGSFKLIDFGLALEEKKITAEAAGTFLYASPEQVGTLKRPVDGRSDLYSLGATLYECITGSPVFNGEDAGAIIQQHASKQAPDIRATVPESRPALAAMIAKLLAKDPDDRYQSAEGLLHDLENIGNLESDGQDSFRLDKKSGSVGAASEVPLTGRETEMARLKEVWERTKRGKGGIVQIEGEGGMGKTRLTQELLLIAQAENALVLKAKSQQAEKIPLGIFREAIDAYLLRVFRMPAEEKDKILNAIRAGAGEYGKVVRQLSKGLERVFVNPPDVDDMDADGEKDRFYQKIAELFFYLSKNLSPVFLQIDDTQWIDSSSAEILSRIAARIDAHPIAIITTARNDKSSKPAADAFFDQVQKGRPERLTLNPLSNDAIEKYVTYFLGGATIDRNVVDRLASATNGNAFAIGEYVRSMLDSGILRPIAGGWQVDMERFTQISVSKDVLQLLIQRMERLSAETMRILRAAAIYGMNFNARQLMTVCKLEKLQTALFALEEATRANIVERSEAESYSFVHDRVYEAVIASISEEEKRQFSQEWAYLLAAHREDNAEYFYALARHSFNGYPEKHARQVFDANLKAGQLALENFAPQMSYEFLTNAESVRKHFVNEVLNTMDLEEALGTAADRTGRSDEAYMRFGNALKEARRREDRCRIHFKLGFAYWNNGRTKEAWENIDKTLSEFGRPFPRSIIMRAISRRWYMLLNFFIRVSGIGYGSAKGVEKRKRKLLTQFYFVGKFIAVNDGDFRLCDELCARSIYNGLLLGTSVELSQSYVWYSIIFGNFNKPKTALSYANAGLKMAEVLGDKVNFLRALQYYMNLTGLISGLGKFKKIREENAQLFDKYLSGAEVAGSDMAYLIYHVERWRSREVVDMFFSMRQKFERLNSKNGLITLIDSGYSQLSALGRFPEAATAYQPLKELEDYIRLSDGNWNNHLANRLLANLHEGNFDVQTEKDIETFQNIRFHSFLARFGYYTIGYIRYEQFKRAKPEERAEAYRKFLEIVEQSKPHSFYPVHKCHYLIFCALISIEDKKFAKAKQLLDQAEQAAIAGESPWGHFYSSLFKARLAQSQDDYVTTQELSAKALDLANREGWKSLATKVAKEFNLTNRQEVSSDSNSLTSTVMTKSVISATYVDALLRVNLASATSFDFREVSAVALDELVRVLNAERSFIFLADADGKLQMVVGRDANKNNIPELKGYSSTVVQKSFSEGIDLVVSGTDESGVLGSQSAIAHGLRSIMAVPLQVADKRIGVVYLDSTVSKGMFTKDHVQLFSAIASHVAISIERARAAEKEVELSALKKDLALTSAVQSFFLPAQKALETEHIKLASFYEPANEASGDWWWHYSTANGELNILVGDVTGHGAASAMLTASTAAHLRALLKTDLANKIPDLLNELNLGFYDIAKGQYNMTMSALRIDPKNKKLNWWNAASPSVFIIKPDKTVETLTALSSPLGNQNFTIGSCEADLLPKSRVVVCTDGILELSLPEGKMLRIKHWLKILSETMDLPTDKAAEGILAQLNLVRKGTPLSDDLTCVVVDV